MALLQDTDRQACTDEFLRQISAVFEVLGAMSKHDARAAVNGLDGYFDANQAAINQSIPEPARSSLTTKQKAFLGMLVLNYRYKVF